MARYSRTSDSRLHSARTMQRWSTSYAPARPVSTTATRLSSELRVMGRLAVARLSLAFHTLFSSSVLAARMYLRRMCLSRFCRSIRSVWA